jgi:hypothetical protein
MQQVGRGRGEHALFKVGPGAGDVSLVVARSEPQGLVDVSQGLVGLAGAQVGCAALVPGFEQVGLQGYRLRIVVDGQLIILLAQLGITAGQIGPGGFQRIARDERLRDNRGGAGAGAQAQPGTKNSDHPNNAYQHASVLSIPSGGGMWMLIG